MRLFSILTALVVVATLYLVVMEREALLDFAGGGVERLRTEIGLGAPEQDQVEADRATEPEPETADADDGAPAAPAREGPRTVPVVAARIEADEIASSVRLRGRSEAARRAEVRAQTSGLVISEPHEQGDEVAEGQLLCELESGTREARLREAEARLEEARINYDNARRLSQDGYAPETRVSTARAALQSAEAAVETAEEELARLRIAAPFAGVLETDTAELGTLLQPGSLCGTVMQIDPMRLVAFVSELQVGRIEHGARAGARLTSGREVVGEVTNVARAADPATRTFRVEITVPNPDLTIRAGVTADILVEAGSRRGHLVPGSALTLNDAGEMGLRLVGADNRVVFAPVEVIRDTPEGMWVGGLPDTARVIVVGQEFVSEGVPVTPTWRPAPETPGAGAAPGGDGDSDGLIPSAEPEQPAAAAAARELTR
ncbi:efflux RND transporter periplasmic adaptor subunit [Rhodobacteraceae bacterium WD3A24]|nr:efflux RND transporter periplasmic adaptor subunit [Rhodobacteraceae bacterium WD3A24]